MPFIMPKGPVQEVSDPIIPTSLGHRDPAWLPWLLILALCSPVLIFRYLPMTDFPQHLAVLSVLRNHLNPFYGFSDYFSVEPGRTLYWLPYGLALGLSTIMPLDLALRCVVFLSVLGLPLGLLALLTALGRPRVLALLGLPLAYNRAFFWGFINFNLSVALALLGMALLCRPRLGRGSSLLLGALGLAITLCHTHGLLLLLGFALLALPSLPWRESARRFFALGPALLGTLAWAWLAARQDGYGEPLYPSLGERLVELPEQILGGYQDLTEICFLLIWAAVFLSLAWRTLPVAPGRWRMTGWPDRALFLLAILNIVAYLFLPQDTLNAKLIHFRHAWLFVFLLCPLVPASGALLSGERRRPLLLALVLPALLAIASAWGHLHLFHEEAKTLDAVITRMPERPRLAYIAVHRKGQVARGDVYWHSHAYIQVRRGGVITDSFAKFWNIPIAYTVAVPYMDIAKGNSHIFDLKRIGNFFNWLLVRNEDRDLWLPSDSFPYRLEFTLPPWQVYRSIDPPG